MDAATISATIKEMGLESDPAFKDVAIYIQPIPEMDHQIPLGLYYSDEPISVIVIPKEGDVETLKHELGHRYGDYCYQDLTEDFAQAFSIKYSGDRPRILMRGSYIECTGCDNRFYAPGGEAACPKCGAVYRRIWR